MLCSKNILMEKHLTKSVKPGVYEHREVARRSIKLHQPSAVKSHFQQNLKYGEKDGFKLSVPKWVGNY